MFLLVFSLCTTVTSRKKSDKLNASICYKTRKVHFGCFLSKHPSVRFFQKKSFECCCNCMQKSEKFNALTSDKTICVNFKFLCCHNLMQKIIKILSVTFSENLKNLILNPFGPKTSKQDFYIPKNNLVRLLQLHAKNQKNVTCRFS